MHFSYQPNFPDALIAILKKIVQNSTFNVLQLHFLSDEPGWTRDWSGPRSVAPSVTAPRLTLGRQSVQ